jgi:hypothetical protein
MKRKLTENEIEILFLWRGLSWKEQCQIIGMIELLLKQRKEKDGTADKEPSENNVVWLKKED